MVLSFSQQRWSLFHLGCDVFKILDIMHFLTPSITELSLRNIRIHSFRHSTLCQFVMNGGGKCENGRDRCCVYVGGGGAELNRIKKGGIVCRMSGEGRGEDVPHKQE